MRSKEVTYQCQGTTRSGDRCKGKATYMTNGKNLCSAHHWLAVAAKGKLPGKEKQK